MPEVLAELYSPSLTSMFVPPAMLVRPGLEQGRQARRPPAPEAGCPEWSVRPDALVGLPVLLCHRPHYQQVVEDLVVATGPSASCRQVLSTLVWLTFQPLRLRRAVGAVLSRRGNQVCNRLDVSGDGNGLSMLDRAVEFGQAHLGLRSLNLTHVDSNLLF